MLKKLTESGYLLKNIYKFSSSASILDALVHENREIKGYKTKLAEHAGFRKITQRIDEWGIFTVSLAVRAG